MTTNQTIDGVPRKSLEQALKLAAVFDDGGDGADAESARGVVWILRALLDAPAKAEFSIPDCPDCACVQDGQCLCIPSKLAAQPQGEPVAWLGSGVPFLRREDAIEYASYKDERVTALYAEQPAPLKIGRGVTVRNIGFGSDEERKPYLVFADNGNLTEVNLVDVSMISRLRSYTVKQLEELGIRVEPPAQVAVALPDPVTAEEFGDESMANGWNACLDELTRLNTK